VVLPPTPFLRVGARGAFGISCRSALRHRLRFVRAAADAQAGGVSHGGPATNEAGAWQVRLRRLCQAGASVAGRASPAKEQDPALAYRQADEQKCRRQNRRRVPRHRAHRVRSQPTRESARAGRGAGVRVWCFRLRRPMPCSPWRCHEDVTAEGVGRAVCDQFNVAEPNRRSPRLSIPSRLEVQGETASSCRCGWAA
jgi:hypothetical protein